MPSIDELNECLAIADVARFEAGNGGLTRLVLTAPGGEAHLYLHGAHVTHYQPSGNVPVLFASAKSHFQAGKPIRGGVPVIFPWFGPRQDDPDAPMHGFVRTREWDVEEVARLATDRPSASLKFSSDEQTRALWPHDFALSLSVVLTNTSLQITFTVHNTSADPFAFEEALHTYLAVQDVRQTTIANLGGTEYLDKNRGMTRHTQEEPLLQLTGPTDRVYVNTGAALLINDRAGAGTGGREIELAKDNSHSTVVWTPWSDKIGTMADLDPQEWTKFVCVETANVKENAVTLRPGAKYDLYSEISIKRLEP